MGVTHANAEEYKDVADAVDEAKATYEDAKKDPFDHGHAFIKGLDGRTKLVQRLSKHKDIRIENDGYHGVTLHIDGVNRYLTAQRGAYDVFMKTLQSRGYDVSDWRMWTHRD